MNRNRRAVPAWRLNPITAAILCSGALNVLPAAAQTPTQAEPDALTLPPITVTGEVLPPEQPRSAKFTAPVVDTPQTLSIIPESVYRQQGAQNLTDVLGNTPGISFSAGENGFATNTNNFQLRGFDGSGNIFIDGVRDSGNYSRDIFNIEQVEVAKGPAADNGRGGAGGYVNLVTKSPKLENAAYGTVSYGFDEYDADGRARGTLDVNRTLGANSAGRVNLLVQDGGVVGRDVAEAKTLGFAPSIAFGLDTATRLVASYQYLEQDDLPDWGVPAAFIDGMLRYDPAIDENERDNFYGLNSDYDEVTAHSLLARIEHDFASGVLLSNQTRWSQTEREARYTLATGYDAGTREVSTQTQFFARETSTLANLTNLSLSFQTGGLKHTLATGLELTREESDADRFATINQPGTDVDNPDPNRAAGTPPAPTATAATTIDTMAVYVYDTIEFSERWQLTGGLRAERYEVELDNKNLDGTPGGAGDDYDVSETTLGGKLGLVFKPAANGSLYASVGLSSLPPGSYLSNPDISRTGDNVFPGFGGQNNPDAKVQRAINYEVGAKWAFFDERLLTTVALFQTERRNVAITGKTPGEPDSEETLQGYGKQIVKGIELSATGHITSEWSVFAGLGLLDSERQHSAFLDAARREASPNDYGDYLTTDGDELAFTPNVSANLWTTYRFTNGFTVGGGVKHVGDSYVGRPDDADRIIPNGQFGELPGYTVVNAVFSYDVGSKLSLRLNVDNITDELYAVSSNWPAQRVLLGTSRAFLLSADYRF